VWQCVALCGRVWPCVAVCCSVWQCGSMLQGAAVCCSVWQSFEGGESSYDTHKPTHTSRNTQAETHKRYMHPWTESSHSILNFSVRRLVIVCTLSNANPCLVYVQTVCVCVCMCAFVCACMSCVCMRVGCAAAREYVCWNVRVVALVFRVGL